MTSQLHDTEVDYIQMAMSAANVNTPHDLWRWIEDKMDGSISLVFVTKDGQLNFYRGVKVSRWLTVAQAINKMIEDAVV